MTNLKPGQVIVDTRVWERAHRSFVTGHAPKPRGEGNWMFCTQTPGSDGYLDKLIPRDPVARTYAEQKKAAQRWAAAQGILVIYVCD